MKSNGNNVLILQLVALDTLPPFHEITMEMAWDYFPWMDATKNPGLWPRFDPEYQPERLSLNESVGIDRMLKKLGLNIKV